MLTIFTPAYNRASLLPRLFASIEAQVNLIDEIEWLVVDDGSTDNTQQVLEKFRLKRPDLVRYVRTSNGGKHRAINLCASIALGEWVLLLDSDDILRPLAVSEILKELSSLSSDVGLLRGLAFFPELPKRRNTFRIPVNPATHALWKKIQKGFDSAEVVRRDLLLSNKFSEHDGELFQAESWLWYGIDKTHKTKFVNSYWLDCFYQPDGLSERSRELRASCPLGAMDTYRREATSMRSGLGWYRASANWWRYYFHAKRRRVCVRDGSNFGLSLMALPLGVFMYLADRVRVRSRFPASS